MYLRGNSIGTDDDYGRRRRTTTTDDDDTHFKSRIDSIGGLALLCSLCARGDYDNPDDP